MQEVITVNQCVQNRFPGNPPGDVGKFHLLEARNVGGAHRQVGVQQPLDLIEHFEERAAQVPANVVPCGTPLSREYQLVLRRVLGQGGPVSEQQHGRQRNVRAGDEAERFKQLSIPKAGQVPALAVGGDGLAQSAHLLLNQVRETDVRHGIGGDIAPAPRHEELRQGRSRERLRVLSDPYPRDPIRRRMRRQAAWHAHYEEAALGLLQFVDFDENVRFRTVIDAATETGCDEIADALDGVRPGPLAVRHTKYDETAPCVGERDHGLPQASKLGLALLAL